MVAGSKADGSSSSQAIIPFKIRRTIQSIKEIVRNHSDAEIYAMLKETNMDPNETAQKLLNQDPFLEVKRKKDKKKENAGYRDFSHTKRPMEQNTQWAKSTASWDQNTRKGGYARNPLPGISREFRIVRDNRVTQAANCDVKQEISQHTASGSRQVSSYVLEKRNSEGQKVSQGVNLPHDSGQGFAKAVGLGRSGGPLPPEVARPMVSGSISQERSAVQNNSQTHATVTSTNSVIGVYSSSSDPVHVPSPDSRSAGTVGAIRREVGAVGVRKQSADFSAAHSSVSKSSHTAPPLKKDISASAESFGHTAAMSKSSHLNQTPASEPNMTSLSSSRPFSGSQHSSKQHQQSVGHQKAMQPNREWKPKSSQKPTIISSSVIGITSVPSSSSSDSFSYSSPVDTIGLPDKFSQINILENQHVIIPQHLRVPEAERTRLTFGNFGAGFDSNKGVASAPQEIENAEDLNDELSASEDASAADQEDVVDHQDIASRPDSSTSAAESDSPPIGNNESLSSQNIESYAEIGLVQSHSPPYSSPESHQQNPPSMSNFSAYDPQTSYDVPFFRTVMEDNVQRQGLASPSEALSSHAANSSPPSTMAMAHQQSIHQQQQQQQTAQLYPQLQFSHLNYMPYRHVFSPVYGPPMAIPNYPNSPSYPHPSNGSNYLLMPGGSPHLATGGIKYAASQYKQIPAANPTGYGNYTNPAGFTISGPANVGGATGLEDVTRIKYKDNNLYVPNPQADPSDIWIQTPRELPSMQSAPYYNLSGQTPQAGFLPAHAGHAPFNPAVQPSHVQYPGLYHQPQPANMPPSSHHLVHQQVHSGFSGGLGVGVVAPGPQVGTYQQPHISHLNWSANF